MGSAAVYVPGGRAPYPSTVVMGVVTARSAGVIDVAVCAPPGPDGQIDPVILGACRLCGVERVYRMGGAQAIAALAHGTESVERVDVIVGPGNLYVQEAKSQCSEVVGIDGFAGPSDLLVALGASVDEREIELAALDMLAQAEHGTGSLVVGVSANPAVCDALAAALQRLVLERPTVGEAAFAIAEVSDARQAIAFANAFAPEHLQLIGAEVEALAAAVSAAGCVFVGADSATAFGDYVAGSNHVLPDRRRRALCLNAVRPPLPPHHVRGQDHTVGRRQTGGRRRTDRTRGGIYGARRIDGGASARECTAMSRTATIERKTGETDVKLTLTLDGTGAGTRSTGVGFLDHMLDLLARHGHIDLDVDVAATCRRALTTPPRTPPS